MSIFYVPEQTFDVLVKNTQSFLKMLAIPRIHIGEILSFAESLSLDKTQIELQKIVNIVKVICFFVFLNFIIEVSIEKSMYSCIILLGHS